MYDGTRLTSLALLLLSTLLVSTTVLRAGEVIRDFRGNSSTTTVEFEVDGPWLLDWRLDGDYEYFVALDISLIDARTGRHAGQVLHTKYIGNGVKLFHDGGKYQLRVSSTLARWRIKIEQITMEEAQLYTPRKSN